MKRNILLWATFLMITCPLFFTNCSNDPKMDAVPPSFKEVVVSPNSIYPGESVTATIKFQDKGKSWYKITYNWTLTYDKNYSIKGDSFSLDMKEPSFPVVVPDTAKAGTYTLSVSKKVKVEGASLFQNGNPTSSAEIENNSVTFTVKEKEE